MTKKTKFSHKAMAMFLILIFLPSLFPVNYIFASNNGPTAPEASSFEPVDALDMVNLATGDLSYVLPLLDVPSPEGGYPLALSYHSGIALDQEASWVGLGWTLNPGALNRNIVGVPDDWKNGLKSKISFDDGGTIKIDDLYLGVGISDKTSVGLQSTWVTNKTTGGERSINFATRLAGKASFTTKNGTNINLSASTSVNKSSSGTSLGIGIQSENVKVPFQGNSSNSDQTSTSGSYSSTPIGTSLSINLNLGLFRINYNRSKFKYWHFDEKDYYATGSLYSGNFDANANEDPLYFFNEYDASESLSSTVDYSFTFSENNPAYVTYDNYNVDAQGLNGNISPKLLEIGRVHTADYTVGDKSLYKYINGNERKVDYVEGYNFGPDSDIRPTLFSKSLENDLNRPYFYMENEFSSYHKTVRNTRTNFLNQQNETDFSTLLRGIQYFPDVESDGYNNTSNRLKKGNYIETYTNKELLAKYLIYDVSGLDRTSMPEDGIGAFKVTVMDGKTYHYSLPVYQKESSQVTAQSDADVNLKHMKTQSLQPYATHWLLTAITGPGFVDNGDGQINEGDFGYWVRFDYGKWSDGYTWRMPKSGFNYTDNAKTYSWGVKDVYYLNSISTRTHTALFVKKERLDNFSSQIGIHDSNNNPIFRNSLYRAGSNPDLLHRGADGNWYFAGAYRKLNLGNDPGLILYNNPTIENENWFYAKSKQIKSYSLDEIILLKNDEVPDELKSLSLSSGNLDSNQEKNFEIKFEEQTFYAIGSNDYNTEKEAYVDNVYRGEYTNNILDSEDFDFASLRESALKVINFGYSYSLGKDADGAAGKLSLESVSFKGKRGIQVIPPYKFDYYNENYILPRSSFDNWGYHKTIPWAWSLKDITHPLGGKISMEYESDSFLEKSVASSYLDNNLQVKFEGSNGGDKYVSIRQDPDIELEQELNLLNYFKVDDYYNLDVQFFQDPSHNGDNWIADVASSCKAVSVSEDVVKFQMPTNSTKTWVRLKTNCEKQNWVYYQSGEYNHVVDVTKDWRSEDRELSCDIPGDGNRKIKIRVFFDESDKEQLGGGIRTHRVAVEDGLGNSYKTIYDYNLLDNSTNLTLNATSGVTSYAPERMYQKNIPYMDLLPSPGVLYKNVRVNHVNNTYTDYLFETIENYTIDQSGYQSNLLKINIIQGESIVSKQVGEARYFQIDEKFYEIENKLNSLGSLISVSEYNRKNQLIGSSTNSYLQINELEDKFITESFVKEEKLNIDDTFDIPVNLSTTTISQIPSVIKEIKTIKDNYSFITKNNLFDPVTGQVLETITSNSKGDSIKNKIILSYMKYPSMGSKVDNKSNKNMLSQQVASTVEMKTNSTWRKIAADITTWHPTLYVVDTTFSLGGGAIIINYYNEENVWRKHKNYVWNGNTDAEGFFTSYTDDDDGFDWANDNNSNSEWKQLSEISKYNEFSVPLETLDVNGNRISTKMDYKNERPFTSANAGYDEMFYSGAEDLNGTVFGGDVNIGTASENTNFAHTGAKSLEITSGNKGYVVSVTEGKSNKYKASLWVKYGNHLDTRLRVGSTVISHSEMERAGDWVQLNFYFDINGTKTVEVYTNGSTIYVDDFRLCPVSSTMSSYVYNEFDELTHILGANNMATQFEYDAAGRLKRTLVEVIDFSSEGSGGFKRTSENEYTYKNNASN